MRTYGRYAFPLALFGATACLFYAVQEILLPFLLAAVQAFLFNPVIRFFEVRGVRRAPVVVIFYVGLMSAVSIGLYKGALVAAQEAEEAARQMPAYVAKGSQYFERVKRQARHPTAVFAFDYAAQHGRLWPERILRRMPSFASGMLPMLQLAFLVPFLAFFFMREGPALRDALLTWVPSRYVEMALNLIVEIDNSLGKYVRGISLEAFCVGCLAYAGFWLIGLDYAFQIALVVGLVNIVPYVGPVIGGLLGSGVALFQWGDLTGVAKVLAVCASVRFIEDWFIQPTVLRHAVHLHPVAIIFSLMTGAQLAGFWGLLFAVPVACMIKVLLDVLWPWYRSQYGLQSPAPLPEVNRIPLI